MKNKQLAVVIGIIEFSGKILVTRRVAPNHPQWNKKWEVPGGKINAGETPEQALCREVNEETGLIVRNPELLGVHTHFWDFETHIQQTFLICFRCKSESQEVYLNPSESDCYMWVTPDEFLDLEETLDGEKELFKELYIDFSVSGLR